MYKKGNEFLQGRLNLKNTNEFKGVFIAEYLTPIRAKLLRHLKFDCDNKFAQILTINGNSRFKKYAIKEGLPPDDQFRDPGIGIWLSISSHDNLFKLKIDIDYSKFYDPPLNYNAEPEAAVNEDTC